MLWFSKAFNSTFGEMHLDKNSFTNRLGNAIREKRLAKAYSIEKLALISGLDYSHLSRIERGVINTSVYHLFIISKALDVSMCQLIGFKDN